MGFRVCSMAPPSVDMVSLEAWLDGPSAQSWLGQLAYDLRLCG